LRWRHPGRNALLLETIEQMSPHVANVIQLRNFSFRIGRKEILRGVSFAVRQGEYLTIVGPNGAGKTTLLKCIDRILPGGSGSIEVGGRPLASYRQKELARRISYVPQADGRTFPFTVEQFVLMGRYPYLNPFSSIGQEDRQAVRDAMEMTGTAAFADPAPPRSPTGCSAP